MNGTGFPANITVVDLTRALVKLAAPGGRRHPLGKFTATVLQPGRYKLVRSGQSAVGDPAK